LGADTMLEYPIAEARDVLQNNLDKCEKALADNMEDWGKVKDCKTTCEVNIARCHNYDVSRRKASTTGQLE
jgi:Prefoldin subunit